VGGTRRQASAAGNPGGCDEHETPGTPALGGRQLGRHQPAERVAGEVDPLQAGGVEPAAEPAAQPIGPHRRVQAWQIDDVDLALRAQRAEQRRPPSPRARQAVNEHERLAAAGDAIADRTAVNLGLAKLDVRLGGVVHLIQSGRCLAGRPVGQWSLR